MKDREEKLKEGNDRGEELKGMKGQSRGTKKKERAE
jgi:hypothetical protein